MRIVVAGALASKPGYGGEAWVRMAWVRGLQELGAEVIFVEELAGGTGDGAHASRCVPGRRFFRSVVEEFGMEGSAGLITARGDEVAGLPLEALTDFAAEADLLINLSGNLTCSRLFDAVRRRAYVDLDPGYTQFWHAAGVGDLRLEAHDVHFTVGANVGRDGCGVPTSGIEWIPIRRPVLLDEWPVAEPVDEMRFTTVASWRGAYGPVDHGGERYLLKAHEFRKVAELPRRLPLVFEIALDIHPADAGDRRLMEQRGWILADPREAAGTPSAFRRYVRSSGAEFSVAQGIYVETASGWISDRSARYLAAGRPAVVQETGFRRDLPVGEGLLSFRTVEEAEAAVRAVARDRRRHERAARQIAEAHFDARTVLSRVLERAAPRSRPHGVGAGEPSSASRRRSGSAGAGRRVVVSGMFAGVPGQGGATWAALQYVLGLRQLGHQVLLVEEVDPHDLVPGGVKLAASRNAAYFRRITRRFGLEDTACMVLRGTSRTVGLPWREVERRIEPDTLLLNLSGTLRDPRIRDRIPVRVYLDLDPTFTQIWHEEGVDVGLDGHTHFATVGLGLGGAGCDIPCCDIPWIPTLPPVVLDLWSPRPPLRRDALTTVANWRGYGSVSWNGATYGQKAHTFRELFDLPGRLRDERFELALAIHEEEEGDRMALERNGWRLLDPVQVAGSPQRYRRFVRGSAAELGVAKDGYVRSRCGWFSDRSACYLAAGRPVLAQDTGFPDHLPTGEGLLSFRTAEEAAEGVRSLRTDYARHARAALEIAREHLDARRVLGRLLDQVAA